MAMRCVRLWWTGLILLSVFSVSVSSESRVILLNDLADANLAYFQTSFPVNRNVDGTLLFQEIQTDGGFYKEVRLTEISDLARQNDLKQIVDMDGHTNTLNGTLYVREATLSAQEFVMNIPFRFLNVTNAVIDLISPSVDVSLSLKPSDGFCNLSAFLRLSIERASLTSTMGSDWDITTEFRKTFVEYINSKMGNIPLVTVPGNCVGSNAFDALTKGYNVFSSNTLAQLIEGNYWYN